MEDLTKQLSEVGEESPASDGLMFKVEMTLNADFSMDSLEEDEPDVTWEN
jgi:hypothetical protein